MMGNLINSNSHCRQAGRQRMHYEPVHRPTTHPGLELKRNFGLMTSARTIKQQTNQNKAIVDGRKEFIALIVAPNSAVSKKNILCSTEHSQQTNFLSTDGISVILWDSQILRGVSEKFNHSINVIRNCHRVIFF